MKQFRFIGIRPGDNTHYSDTIAAQDEHSALKVLSERGIAVKSIHELRAATPESRKIDNYRIAIEDDQVTVSFDGTKTGVALVTFGVAVALALYMFNVADSEIGYVISVFMVIVGIGALLQKEEWELRRDGYGFAKTSLLFLHSNEQRDVPPAFQKRIRIRHSSDFSTHINELVLANGRKNMGFRFKTEGELDEFSGIIQDVLGVEVEEVIKIS